MDLKRMTLCLTALIALAAAAVVDVRDFGADGGVHQTGKGDR